MSERYASGQEAQRVHHIYRRRERHPRVGPTGYCGTPNARPADPCDCGRGAEHDRSVCSVYGTTEPELLTVEDVAKLTGLPAATVLGWPASEDAPRVFKVGRLVVYRRSQVEAYVAASVQEVGR